MSWCPDDPARRWMITTTISKKQLTTIVAAIMTFNNSQQQLQMTINPNHLPEVYIIIVILTQYNHLPRMFHHKVLRQLGLDKVQVTHE